MRCVKSAYNGDYIGICQDFMAGRLSAPTIANSCLEGRHPTTSTRFASSPWLIYHEQDLDLKAFRSRFNNYYLESSLYTEGRVSESTVARGRTRRQDLKRMARSGSSPPTGDATRTGS
jgi:arginyl-tRNA synthetase